MQTADYWRGALASDLDFGQSLLLERGELQPLFVIHAPVGLLFFPPNFSNQESETRSAQLVRLICAAFEAQAVCLVSEAWVRRIKRYHDETEVQVRARGRAVAPKDAEDRMEVVLTVLSYRDEAGAVHTLPAFAEIERDAEGKPCGCTPVPPGENVSDFSGSLTDLLAPVELDPEQRRELIRDLDALGIKVAPLTDRPSRLH